MAHDPDGATVDRRHPAFCFQTLDALDAIRAHYAAGGASGKLPMAIAVYVSLTEAANRNGGAQARGGFTAQRKRIAALAGVSVDTFDRYVAELEQAGVVEVESQRSGSVNLPNVWALIDGPQPELETPPAAPPSRTGAARGSRTGAALRARDSSREQRTNPEEKNLAAIAAGEKPDLPEVVKTNGRNVAFDALVEVCDLDPDDRQATGQVVDALYGRGKKGAGGKTAQGIADLAWLRVVQVAEARGQPNLPAELRADPARWAEGLAEMIRKHAELYHRHMPEGSMITPTALRKHWLWLERRDTAEPAASKPMTAAELRRAYDL